MGQKKCSALVTKVALNSPSFSRQWGILSSSLLTTVASRGIVFNVARGHPTIVFERFDFDEVPIRDVRFHASLSEECEGAKRCEFVHDSTLGCGSDKQQRWHDASPGISCVRSRACSSNRRERKAM